MEYYKRSLGTTEWKRWMGEGNTAAQSKRRSKTFHFAMAAVAADVEVARFPGQWPCGFPPASCRDPTFPLQHRRAPFPIGNSHDSPFTRSSGFECNTRWVVRHT
jgi:hypothetical protein